MFRALVLALALTAGAAVQPALADGKPRDTGTVTIFSGSSVIVISNGKRVVTSGADRVRFTRNRRGGTAFLNTVVFTDRYGSRAGIVSRKFHDRGSTTVVRK